MSLQKLIFMYLFFLVGCGNYDEGYEDGWAKRPQITFASDRYKQGYTEGKNNSYYYEQGRQDGGAGRPPDQKMEYRAMYRKGYRDAGGLLP